MILEVWSGSGVTGSIFDPLVAGAGTHIISYSIVAGCSDSGTEDITVVPIPGVDIDRVGRVLSTGLQST
jgi:hypothetical protein